jgi:hypothetical protein
MCVDEKTDEINDSLAGRFIAGEGCIGCLAFGTRETEAAPFNRWNLDGPAASLSGVSQSYI